MKLFEQYKTSKRLIEQTEFVKVYSLIFEGKEYKIVLANKFANDHSFIHCKDGHVVWQQAPRLNWGGKMVGTKDTVYKFVEDKNCVTLFVIKGKPNEIIGLDDGVFRCANNFDETCLNVMTYKELKNL
ncbi:MAG: hypothetical protein IJO76_04490 [Clostridia bacterium]|nr:hypothetical protein [Clostridia bacterium]